MKPSFIIACVLGIAALSVVARIATKGDSDLTGDDLIPAKDNIVHSPAWSNWFKAGAIQTSNDASLHRYTTSQPSNLPYQWKDELWGSYDMMTWHVVKNCVTNGTNWFRDTNRVIFLREMFSPMWASTNH